MSINENPDLKNHLSRIMAGVRLSHKETQMLEADVRSGITYLTSQSLTVEQAFQRIGDDIFGSFYAPPDPGEWYPLDSAAKVYPLSMTHERMSMFRIAANMDLEVIPEMLQLALHTTIKRFPTFATTLKRGLFWHYLDARRKRFVIEEEKRIPCSPIKVDTVNDQVFRLAWFKKRISLEVFHCVTDGYGGMMFLRTLLAEYMRLLGEPEGCSEGILYIGEEPRPEESADAFTMADPDVETARYGNGRAIQIKGKRARIQPAQIIHFRMPSAGLVQASKRLQTTVTGFLLSSIFVAAKAACRETNGVFRIQVPVNMRQYYPIPTLRNFSMYTIINIPFDEVTTIEELAPKVDRQLKEKMDQRALNGMIASTLNLVRNPALKRTPLSLKGLIVSRITNILTHKSFTAVMSNLGNDKGSFGSFVESFEAICGPSNSNQLGCGIITYGDTAVFSITKPTNDPSFESALYNLFTASGLDIVVSGSHLQQPVCPVSGEPAGARMDASYPVVRKISSRRKRLRFWGIMALIVLTAATVIVNIAVGGRTWSLYAVAGSFIHYQAFYARKLVESSLIRKFVSIILSVCVLLVIIQLSTQSEVAAVQFIIPILLWGTLILSAFLYFLDFRSQKSHMLPILFTICLSFVCIGTGFWVFNTIKWPSIVLLSISTFIVLFTILFYRKPVKAELHKKLHR